MDYETGDCARLLTELPKLETRMALVEQRLHYVETDLRGALTELSSAVAAINNQTATMEVQLSKYRGFIGGVVFLGSCLGTFVSIFARPIVHYFKGGG